MCEAWVGRPGLSKLQERKRRNTRGKRRINEGGDEPQSLVLFLRSLESEVRIGGKNEKEKKTSKICPFPV
jgi:hypothetical protein